MRRRAASTAPNHAERAIRMLAEAGVAVGVNLVLTRESFDARRGDRRARCVARRSRDPAPSLQARRPRRGPDLRVAASARANRRSLRPRSSGSREHGRSRVRIDCAMVPLLSKALVARDRRPRRDARPARRLRLRGRAAPRRAHRSTGAPRRAASSRHAPRDTSVRRGLGRRRSARGDPRLPRRSPDEPCGTLPASRGLSRRLPGGLAPRARRAFAPDPECPRVVAHASSSATP